MKLPNSKAQIVDSNDKPLGSRDLENCDKRLVSTPNECWGLALMDKEKVAQAIIESVSWVDQMICFDSNPVCHQFVITGPQVGNPGIMRRIGYCVQVRKGCGQFGSDMVFLRHPDGVLSTHENQCYLAMTQEQELVARGIFECLPHEEVNEDGSDPEYTVGGKFGETGFLIVNSKTEPTPNAPFQITVKNSNGSTVVERFI